MEAPKTAPQTKAGDWRAYQRVILPPVRDLHLLDVAVQNGAYTALEKVLKEGWERKALVDLVKASGLRGRGGAGFSTGLKWSFMPPDKEGQARYLACNGDESEPGTFKDRQIFEYNPHLLFEGMMLGALGIGLGPVLGRGGALGHRQAHLLGQILHRVHEAHAVVFGQEADGVTMHAAAEAVVSLPGRADDEAG